MPVEGKTAGGPLSSLRVVEFSGLGPAPLAGQLLADLGAEVVVIDRKPGAADATDINRRGKKSIALDLKTDAGREVALRLIGASDILIEGFRPGVMERLGLGPDACPDNLIYGRMTGWGQSGSLAQTAGHDLNYLAMTGALNAMGPADRPPAPPLNLVADFGGGTMMLLFGLLAAVIERGVSGKGQVVDAAMVDGVPALMGLIHGFLAQGQWDSARGSNWLDGASHFYRCYGCADGRFISVGALEPQFFAELAKRLALSEDVAQGQLDTETWAEKSEALAAIFKTQPRAHWEALFAQSDACVAPVLTFEEAFTHPAHAERGVFYQAGEVWQASPAPRFGRSTPPRPDPPVGPGASAQKVLTDLGLSAEEITALEKSGAVL